MKVVVGVLLLLGCAALASAESEIDVAATLSSRWGHWTLERLRWKREELNSDLAATRQERNRVNTWGTKTCELIVAMGKARVMAAKEAVSEWTDILAIRRGQRGYHIGRQAGYDRRHLYITEGPLARRNAADKGAWCKANPESCDRWEHERAVYFKHGFDKLKDRHGWDTEHHRKRVGYAKENLKKAVDALATARKIRNDRNAACQKTFAEAKAHWKKRIDWLKTRVVTINQVIGNVKKTRTLREATYKPFYMTKCRYIGGKHHMYYCKLDLSNASKAHHRFRVCHHRGPETKNADVLKFRCYK